MAEIILASGSATRRTLLQNAGINVQAVSHDLDERLISQSETGGRAIARRLAISKAETASRKHRDRFVVGADQTLEINGRVLRKPRDRSEAFAQLRELSGRQHFLYSAFSIACNGICRSRQVRSACLTMRDLGDDDIDWFLEETGSLALTSVGAYQLEGLGIRLFSRIKGDYFAILGLPMLPLLEALRRLGAISP